MSRLQRRWSPQEDSILQREVELQYVANSGAVRDWNSIAQKIKGRSNKDCRKRYYNGITEGLRKGPWTNEEDRQLEKLVRKHGTSWAVIAQDMKTRSADQCSKRWQHCLDPGLDRSSWTQDENVALLNAVRTHDSAWKDIQTLHFPRRSANNVKNQYSVLKRKALGVPDDVPRCCSNAASNASGKTDLHWRSEDMNIPDAFAMELDQPSSPTMDVSPGSSKLDHSISFPSSEFEDPFQWLKSESEPLTIKPETVEDFGLFGSLGDRTPNAGSHLDFDLNLYNDIDIPDSISSMESSIQDSQMNHATHSSQYSESASPHKVDMRHPFLDMSSPGSLVSPFPTLAAPSTQLTIRMEGADPSTLSAVMGTLIQSKARFKFETN